MPSTMPSVEQTSEVQSALSFGAMGTSCHVQIIGPSAEQLAERARLEINRLEQCWSRFLPTSDISRINRGRRTAVAVDEATVNVLLFALDAWRATDGVFSPFVGRAMSDLGYSISWSNEGLDVSRFSRRGPRGDAVSYRPMPVAGECPIIIDRLHRTVTLVSDASLDLGGVGKGFAADMVLQHVMAEGADAALVDLGGDIAFDAGDLDESSRPWQIGVADPYHPGKTLATVVASAGGIATSSTLRRTWRGPNGQMVHHVINPLSGRSGDSGVVSATVLADRCAHAEVVAKQCLLAGIETGSAVCARAGLDAAFVSARGDVTLVGLWEGVSP